MKNDEMKRLCWSILSSLCVNDPSRLQLVVDWRLVYALLLYLRDSAHMATTGLIKWSEPHLLHLQRQALSTLFQLVPLQGMTDEYLKADGPHVVIQFVRQSFINTTATVGTLGRTLDTIYTLTQHEVNYRTTILLASLRFLSHTAKLLDLQTRYAEEDAVQLMVDLFCSSTSDTVKKSTIEVLSEMCAGHSANQERFRNADGIRPILDELVSQATVDQVLPSVLVLVCVGCLWNAVLPSSLSIASFLASGGLQVILQVFEFVNSSSL
ncbi:MAG: hypothetical protein AAFW67_09280 [Cyanobacteria bacterium J06638_38]